MSSVKGRLLCLLGAQSNTRSKARGMSLLEAEKLKTILNEDKAIINRMPFTVIYHGKGERESLTNSHIIIGKR